MRQEALSRARSVEGCYTAIVGLFSRGACALEAKLLYENPDIAGLAVPWVDGLGGIRARYSITDKVYLTGWAWLAAAVPMSTGTLPEASATVLTKKVSAVAGYRALGVDYSSDGFVMDIVEQGPIFGVVTHF